MSRAKAVFIPPAKLVVVARSSYPTQKPPRLPVTETGAVRLLYLCFFKRSRNYLRGFLIAAWAGAKITERSEQQYEIQELLFSPFAIAST